MVRFATLAGSPFHLGGLKLASAPMNWVGLSRWARGVGCSLGMVASAVAAPPDEIPARDQPSSPSGAESAEAAPPLEEPVDPERAVLYTIGPGATLFERWGHTLLCFQPASAFSKSGALVSPEAPDAEELVDTSCFDFGIFPRTSIARIVSGSLRGEPLFVPQELAYQNAIGRYWWLDRTVERQVLPLSAEQVFDLRDRLNEVVLNGEGYSYHPFYNNCSSQVRDAIDELSGGVLRSAGSGPVLAGASLRQIAEQGFSGQMLLLAGLELLVGSSADRATTAWQRGAFPEGLGSLVERSFGVQGHTVYKQTWNPLRTSTHAGRVFVLLMSVGLSGCLVWARRRGGVTSVKWRRTVGIVGALVAGVGLLSLVLRFYSVYPEFDSSWTPLVFFPLDVALSWMGTAVRKRYIAGRLVALAFFASLSLLQLLAQPLVLVALSVALPLGLILLMESRSDGSVSAATQRTDPRPEGAAETI